jgi:deoxycytidylate deaminase
MRVSVNYRGGYCNMNQSNVSKAVDMLFEERKNFIIIGLTGRTGSGCSEVAKILHSKFDELDISEPDCNSFQDNDKRKEYIVYKYMEENWRQFQVIEIRNIITSFILENKFDDFKDYITRKFEGVIENLDDSFKIDYEKKHNEIMKINKKLNQEDSDISEQDVFKFYFDELTKFAENLKKMLNKKDINVYTLVYQDIANNIRSSGTAFSSTFNPNNIFMLSNRTNCLIKAIRKINKDYNNGKNEEEKRRTLIVIDAFRNPYEATFFKDRYSSFYLFSVNCEAKEREERLLNKNLNKAQMEKIDKKEYPDKLKGEEIFSHQNIEKCVELSDVYLYNSDLVSVKKQILKYISLILHPGIITPSHMERCMQIAYNAKANSGCISRQVGAIVTDEYFIVKSIGWNDVPQGQVPCNLKNLRSLHPLKDEKAFSKFELNDEKFKIYTNKITRNVKLSRDNPEVKKILKGRLISYCFKDIYNGMKNDKNQVHTRSLHAEENAFLQISKYGGMKLKDGFLFTTASPCELCAKKAYQIGVKKIYYIDLYPGISEDHILNNGLNKPDLILFHGAIGRAYMQFYTPILSYKDELYMLLDTDFKDINTENKSAEEMVLDEKKKIAKRLFELNISEKIISEIVEISRDDITDLISKDKEL